MTVPEVLERFRRYHQRELAWGSLHVVLDDHNVSDASVRFCLEYAQENQDHEGAELARLLLQMSWTQRLKIAHNA